MNNIIEVSKQAGKKARKLWLNAIDANIYIENLEKKYDFQKKPFDVESILGEYDAPEKQEQGLVVYSLAKQGNTAIYGNDEVEKENLLNVLIYSICKNYMATEVNIYILDYGSEQTRMFENFPQVGGIAYVSDEETTKNTFKFISEEIKYRKKLFSSYGGSIDIYNSKNEERLPQILFAINNYEGLLDLYGNIGEGLGPIARECERYGISIVVTCSAPSVMGRRLTQSFNNKYTLHLPDTTDYMGIFNITTRMNPRDILGRGILKGESLHEFQTASIVNQDVSLNDHLDSLVESIKQQNSAVSKPIPVLPEIVTLDTIIKDISTLTKVPIGIARESLRTIKYDFMQFPSTLISSNKLININGFMDSL